MIKKKIEMKNDGKDSERFEAMLRKVVSVPRKDILAQEAKEKEAKADAKKHQPLRSA